MKIRHRRFLHSLLALVLAISSVVFLPTATAAGMTDDGTLNAGEAMLIDGLLVRPVMVVGTALGVVAFVGTLPFSVLGGYVDEAGKLLVLEPAEYTFVRPLGDL